MIKEDVNDERYHNWYALAIKDHCIPPENVMTSLCVVCISSYHMPYFVILRYLNRIIVLPKIEEVRGLEEFKQWVAKDHPPLGLSIFNSIFCLFHTIFFNLISQC